MKNGKVVLWTLFGLIIAGPNSPKVYPQDSRLARLEDGKSNSRPLTASKTAPNKEPVRRAPHEKVAPPEIILPDIYISIPLRDARSSENLPPAQASPSPLDSTRLKQKLQKTEIELRRLQNERHHLLKTMEQLKMRPLKGASRSVGQTTELLGRPSV